MAHDPWTILGWLIVGIVALSLVALPIALFAALQARRAALERFATHDRELQRSLRDPSRRFRP
ncbi:MAG: hypothetical protein PGN12_06025 [Sphingomonas phyllosphaerae]